MTEYVSKSDMMLVLNSRNMRGIEIAQAGIQSGAYVVLEDDDPRLTEEHTR